MRSAKVLFVSESEQDLVYDLISTTRESQYEKHDEQPAYSINFEGIKAVDAFTPITLNQTGPTPSDKTGNG